MTIRSEYFFVSSDGKTLIHVNQWTPVCREVIGVVQIAHGVAEYAKRYAPLAEYLCGRGFVVVANDHLGHGQSLIDDAPMAYLGEKDGWWHAVEDMETLRCRTAAEFADRPYFLLGHSMGSFLSRSLLIKHPGTLDGCILSGTGHQSALMIAGGKLVADREISLYGKRGYSVKAEALAFGAYNKAFLPARTKFDWISVNTENVDAYIADPLCGGNTTLGLFRDMLDGLDYITRQANINRMDKDLPVLFLSGSQDPVGDMGRGVEKACADFKKAGLRDVTCKLYHGMRHEIFNETAKRYVYRDVLDWLMDRV